MISVDGLVSTPSLELTYLAGAAGGARLVTWAHACDLPDPWRWCKPGHLVMINCSGLPEGPAEQREWLTRLIDSGVSALAISARPGSHEITGELLAVADERGFPVLGGSWDLEFVALARIVIESAIQTERERLTSTGRLYDLYRQALRSRVSFAERLGVLERTLGWRLHLVDEQNRQLLASSQPDAGTREAAVSSASAPTVEPADGDIVVNIPARRPALLIARPRRTPVLDGGLLQHLGGLITVELEHHAGDRDRLRASGSEILRALLDGDLEFAAVRPELRSRGLDDPLVVACWGTSEGAPALQHDDAHLYVGLGQLNPPLLARDGCLVGIMPDSVELIEALAGELGPSCVAGVSTRLSTGNGVIEATRQAELAMGLAAASAERLRTYGGAQATAGLVPHSIDEARQIVGKVLGPLLDHDAAHGTDLTRTLHTFLESDRVWRHTAKELSIHRQTLVYRMRKIEELAGYKPTSTIGTATFWQAFEAARHAGLIPWLRREPRPGAN